MKGVGHTSSNHVPRRLSHHRQRSKEGGTRGSGMYGYLARVEEAPSYKTSATSMTTHHDHEIRIEVLHIQIILSGLGIIQSKPRDLHETRTSADFLLHIRSTSRVICDVASNTVIASPAHLKTSRTSEVTQGKWLEE